MSAQPVAFQVGVISIGLNSTIFFAFLMGIHTTVYFGTVYLYVTRKTSQTRVVTATITVLYLLIMAQLAIAWQLSQSIYVDSGETRETIFNATFTAAWQWSTFASQIGTVATNILADGLLIWRCYYAWGRSLFAISLPFFFLVAETGIYTGVIIFSATFKLALSERQGMIVNSLMASGYFATFFPTISSTLLIVYRIYHSLLQQDNYSKKRFLHIVDVVVQSAAMYALALLVSAIIVLITSEGRTTLPMIAVISYEGGAIFYFVSGMAPTIMVARVALATDTTVVVNSTNVHISGLQFQGNSGIDSNINGGINNAVVIGQSSQKSEKPTPV